MTSSTPDSEPTPPADAPRRKTGAWIVGARTFAFVALLVALELGLYHVGNYGKWVVQVQDAELGWRMLPNQSGWSREYDIPEDINGFAQRDREWDPDESNVYRVAVLGNSLTYGSGVVIEETWPRAMEAVLQAEFEARGRTERVEVMNFAVQGYTFEQMARAYERLVLSHQPELLMIPLLTQDYRAARPPVVDADYPLKNRVLRTATYEMLRDRVIGKWIPTAPAQPAGEVDLGAVYLERALPAVRETWWELHGDEPELATPAGESPSAATSNLERLERVMRASAKSEPATDLPRFWWDALSSPELQAYARLSGIIDLEVLIFRAMEDALPHALWDALDEGFKNGPFSAENRCWWLKAGEATKRMLRLQEGHGGALALIDLTRLDRVVNAFQPPTPDGIIREPKLFFGPLAEAMPKRRIVHLDTRIEFAQGMPTLAGTFSNRGFPEDGDGNRILPPYFPGAEESLFLPHDLGHFSAAGHLRLGELAAAALIEAEILMP